MRDKIILILLIIIIAISSFTSNNILVKGQTTMINLLKDMEENASVEAFNNIKNKWDSINGPWHFFINQKDIDDINLHLSRLSVYVKQKDHANISLVIAILNTLLHDIVEREKLTWYNII